MIESFLMGLVAGFILGTIIYIVPENLKRHKDNYVDITRRNHE